MKKQNHNDLIFKAISLNGFCVTLKMVTALLAVTIFVYTRAYSQKTEINNINLYIEQGEYDKAKALGEELLASEDYSTSAEVQYYIGKAFYEYIKQPGSENNTDFEEKVLAAKDAFDRCQDLDTEGDFIAQSLTRSEGVVSIVQNKTVDPYSNKAYEQALKLIKISIQINPVPNNYKLAGVCADALGQHEDALSYYTKLVELEKQEINVYKRIIKLSGILNKSSEEHSQYLELAMKAYPDDKAFLHDQINVMQESGEVDPLLLMGLYQKILDLDSTDQTALFNIGVIFYNNAALSYNKGKKEDATKFWTSAMEYWERAYAVDSSDADTKTYLNDVYTKLGLDKKLD